MAEFRAWRVNRYSGRSGRTIAAETSLRAVELYWSLYPKRTPGPVMVDDHTGPRQEFLLSRRIEGELRWDSGQGAWVLIAAE